MSRNLRLFLGLVSVSVFLIVNCSQSSDSSTALNSLSSMPAATGDVSSSAIIKGGPSFLDLQTDASTGVRMSAWATTTWDSSTSGAMCETGQMVLRLLSEASQPDKIICYVAAMEAAGAFTSSYDGTNKFYTLAGAGDSEGRPSTMKIKFNMAKDSAGKINDFKMWMCQDGSTQSEYVSESFSGSSATITSVGQHMGDFGSGAQRTAVTGTINSVGDWNSKSITHTGTFSGGSGGSAFSHAQYLTLDQGVDSFTLSGYMTGYYNGVGNTNTGQIYGIIQGLNLSTLATAALGSGSSKFSFSYTNGGRTTYTGTKSWNGDTKAPEASNTASYYSTVSAATLPSATTITTPSFSGSEVWDCAADSGTSFSAIDLANVTGIESGISACNSQFNFSMNSFVNCRSASFN